MHPAEVATRINATSKFAHRTNRGFADATCNVVTGGDASSGTGRHSSCTIGMRTVLFGNSPRKPCRISSARMAVKTIGSALFCWALVALARLRRGQSYEYFMWSGLLVAALIATIEAVEQD